MPNSLTNEVETTSIEFLTFLLNEEIYGVDILSIQEIHGSEQISQIQHLQTYDDSQLNLRGELVPVIDLRNQQNTDVTKHVIMANIIVVKYEELVYALVVDGVSDVISIPKTQICNDPDLNTRNKEKYIAGLFHIDENIVQIIDIERLTQC